MLRNRRLDPRIDQLAPVQFAGQHERGRLELTRSGSILGAGIAGGGTVFGCGVLLELDAADFPRQFSVVACTRKFRALHGERSDRHQRRAIEILEHEQAAAPVGQIEVADHTADLEAALWISGPPGVEFCKILWSAGSRGVIRTLQPFGPATAARRDLPPTKATP